MLISVRQYRGLSGLVLLGTLGAFGASGCGEAFSSCMESRTCRPVGTGGSEGGGSGEASGGDAQVAGGEANAGNETGSEASGGEPQGGSAPTAGAGGDMSGEGGEGSVVPPEEGEPCSEPSALRCFGPAQKVSQICEAGKWATAVICNADENCDQATGACAPILAECAGKLGGQLYCDGDKVFECGPDLVSTEEAEACSGKCITSDTSATCAPVTCGDGKIQAPEDCDDDNEDQTDACTNACKDATCGDGSMWAGHEACDDGNLKDDDACTATCKVATCGDGFVWVGKETCDDKNKVDTDACTNTCKKAACGDGIIQAGREECDDRNAVSGDGCSSTCTVDAPPLGAFAWYKATKDDVVAVNATLPDGNEFIKSSWTKTNLAAEALQPGVGGGSTATALKISGLGSAAMGEVAMDHSLDSSSSYALKTIRIRARMGKWRYLWLGGPASPGSSTGSAPHAFFDLLDGKAILASGATATIMPLANNWYQCEATLVSGPTMTVGVSSSSQKKSTGGVLEPLVWVEGAEVEQASLSKWHDRIAGRDLTDSLRSWRWVAASPELGGLPAIESQQGFASQLQAGAPDDWSFLHDGSGGSFVIVQQQPTPSKLFGNSMSTQSAEGQGIRFGVASTDAKAWEWSASNDSGEAVFSIKGGSSTAAKWLAGTYSSAAQPAAQLFDSGVLVGSAGEVAEPSSAPASKPLTLGGGADSPSQRVHEMLVYERALNGDDVARLKAYFAGVLTQ